MLAWFVALVLAMAAVSEPPPPPTTPVTANQFVPADRDLDECISALPQPDCGSESRGGWRQTLILVAILAGLAFIIWRVARAARRQRRVSHDA